MKQKQKIVLNLSDDEIIIQQLNKPMRKVTDIEVLAKAQHYQSIDKIALFKQMDELGIEESLEVLLAII